MDKNRIKIASKLMGKKLADEEWVFLNLKSGVYYGLNQTGSMIWDELSAHRNPDKALDRLEEIFGTDRKTLERDVKKFLNELHKEGLIEIEKPLKKA